MSKEFRRGNLDIEIEKMNEQIKLLNEMNACMIKQRDASMSVEEHIRNQSQMLELRRKLELQGLKNLQTQQEITAKAAELDVKRNLYVEESLRITENITREKEKQGRVDAENAKKARAERDAELKSDVERIRNHTKINDLEDKQLHRQKAIARAYKDKSDAEKQEIMNNDAKLKQLAKEIELEEKRAKRDERTKQGYNKAVDSINIPGIGSVGSLKEFSEMKVGAQLFSVAVDTFNKAVETFTGLFKDGMNRVYTNSNTQFTNISTRTGMSYGTYRNGISGMGNTLKNWGGYDLQDNLRTSDVQNMMNSLANTGIGQEQLFESAIETALTNSIVPYLDLTSSEMQQFNQNVNGDLMKQVRGIAKVNQEMFGSNEVATKYLQQQLDYLAPMSAVAELDLVQNSEEMMAYYQELRSKGLSDAQIAREMSTVRKIQTDAAGVLRSGNTTDKLAVIGGIQNNRNFAMDSAGVAYDVGSAKQTIANLGPSDGTIETYLFASGFGMEGTEVTELGRLNPDREAARARAKIAASKLNGASESVTAAFANGENQTAAVKQEAYMENISTELAMIKTDVGHWFETLTTAVQGIAKILLAWGAGKLMGIGGGGSGGGLVGSALGKTLAGSVGGSGGLATAAGGALTVAGIAGTIYGAAKTVEYGSQAMKSGKAADWGATGTAAAGTAAVAGGTAMALLASNPVGWAIAAAGGIAIAAADLIEDLGHDGDIMEQLNEASEERLKEFEKSNYEWESSIEDVRETIKSTDDLEQQKRLLVEAGIATEEELQKEQYNNKKALIALTDQYLASVQELNGTSEEIARDIENKQNDEQNQISKDMWELSKKSVNDMSDGEKAAMGEFMKDYYYWMEDLAKKGDKDAQYRIDEWKKYGNNLTDGIVSQDDLNAINSLNTTHYGDNDTTYELFQRYTSDSGNVTKFTSSSKVQDYLGRDGAFKRIDSTAIGYITRAIMSSDKDSAMNLLAQAKALGLTYEYLKEVEGDANYTGQLKDKWDISSYRVGTDNIPYDNYPALLHEGEAVLTASTANELRSLIDEYRETKNDSAKISQAIENQTAVLVEKLNAIYTKMPSSAEAQAQEMMPGRLNQNARNMTTPFNIF